MKQEHKQFLIELKELLEKYNASINWTCGDGSDTYGIYDDKMYVDFRLDKGGYEEIDICNSWGFNARDLIDLLSNN